MPDWSLKRRGFAHVDQQLHTQRLCLLFDALLMCYFKTKHEFHISHWISFYFKINTRCVLKNFKIYFRPATTNQIWLHFRLQISENQWNAPIDMLQTVAALSWWWWWHLLGELTSLLPQWILEKNSAPPPFVKNYILIAISIAFQSFVSPVSLLKPFLIKTCLTLGHELYSFW